MTVEAVPERIEVLIVGAGQAGLSVSKRLTDAGVAHVLIERDEIAHEWRDARWDAFTLVTPNWQCVLPDWPYSGPEPDGFMNREETYAFVRGFADSFRPPVIEHTSVDEITEAPDGGFDVVTSAGHTHADQVVIATGGYHRPVIPTWAVTLPPSITQIHSSEYRNADVLPDGGVLVVGSGQSGTQIAEDLMIDGRQVHLALGNAPRCARFYRGRDCIAWLNDMGVYDRPVGEQAGGLAKRESTNHYMTGRDGGRDIDLRAFAASGRMHLYGRLTGVDSDGSITVAPTMEASLDAADAVMESIKNDIDGYIERNGIEAPTEERYTPVWRPDAEPERLDLAAAGITSIVWCIGFRADYRYIKVGVFDGTGAPTHQRGITRVPGLSFIGLPWLHTWGSGRFAAIARDSAYLVERIIEQRDAGRRENGRHVAPADDIAPHRENLAAAAAGARA